MNGWTKGPWGVEDEDSDGGAMIPISAGPCPSPDYRYICDVRGNGKRLGLTAEDRANARLIAAAPSLAAALEGAVWALENAFNRLGTLGDDNAALSCSTAAKEARAVLAAAKGEQS